MKIYKTKQKDTIDLCNFKSYLSWSNDLKTKKTKNLNLTKINRSKYE